MIFPDQPAGSHQVFSSTRPVRAPGRPGPGSTHWAGPDFKTIMGTIKTRVGLPFFFFLVIKVYKTYLKTIIKRFYFISVFCFFFFIFIMLVLKL